MRSWPAKRPATTSCDPALSSEDLSTRPLAQHQHLDMRTCATSARHVCWSLASFSVLNPPQMSQQLTAVLFRAGTWTKARSFPARCRRALFHWVRCSFTLPVYSLAAMLKQEVNLECWLSKLSASLCMFLQFFRYDDTCRIIKTVLYSLYQRR